MKIAIIDDCFEFAGRFAEKLSAILESADNFNTIEIFTNDFFNIPFDFDVYFIDIELVECSGFELSKFIYGKNQSAIIVFVTAISNYVYESFEYAPFAFLRKEYISNELPKLFSRIQTKYQLQNSYYEFNYKGVYIKIPFKDIIYFEKDNNNLYIITRKKSYTERKLISSVTPTLSSSFIKISRSYLINMDQIVKVENTHFVMSNGDSIYFRKKFKQETLNMYYNYLNKQQR